MPRRATCTCLVDVQVTQHTTRDTVASGARGGGRARRKCGDGDDARRHTFLERQGKRSARARLFVLLIRVALLPSVAWLSLVMRSGCLLLLPLPDASIRRVRHLDTPAQIGSPKTPLSEAYASEPGLFLVQYSTVHCTVLSPHTTEHSALTQ